MVDYAISQRIQDLIPKGNTKATLNVRVTSHDGTRILQGVLAAKVGEVWGLKLGGALAGAVDLHNTDNYQVEILAVLSSE